MFVNFRINKHPSPGNSLSVNCVEKLALEARPEVDLDMIAIVSICRGETGKIQNLFKLLHIEIAHVAHRPHAKGHNFGYLRRKASHK